MSSITIAESDDDELQKALDNLPPLLHVYSEEVQKRLAAEEVQKRLAAEDEQKRLAAEDVQKRLAAEDEQKRLAAEDEQKRLAAAEETGPSNHVVFFSRLLVSLDANNFISR